MSNDPAAGLSDHLCGAIAGFAAQSLPETALAAARHVLLDALGVMLGASRLAE